MKNMIIENKKLRKAMDENGLKHFSLAKNKDYFWIVANKDATTEEEFLADWAESIGVYAFNRQSIDQWIKDIKDTLEKARQDHIDWFNRGKDPNWYSGECKMSIENHEKDNFSSKDTFKKEINKARIDLEEEGKITFLNHTVEYSYNEDNAPTGYLLVDNHSQYRSWEEDCVKRIFLDIINEELKKIFEDSPYEF